MELKSWHGVPLFGAAIAIHLLALQIFRAGVVNQLTRVQSVWAEGKGLCPVVRIR